MASPFNTSQAATILLSLLLLSGCGRAREAAPENPAGPREEAVWVFLFETPEGRPLLFPGIGEFVRFAGDQAAGGDDSWGDTGGGSRDDGRFRPWVEKARAVEFHEIGGRFFVTLNRTGVAELLLPGPADLLEGAPSGSPAPGLKVFPAGGFFSRRTLGSSFVYRGQIISQIYEDAVFSEPQGLGGPSLASFSPETGGYSSLHLDLRPGWELVECLAGEDRWYLALKSRAEEVEFSHFAYDPDSRKLKAVSVDEYRRAFYPAVLSRAPGALRDLSACVSPDEAGRVNLFRVLGGRPDPLPAFFIAGSLEALRTGEQAGREFLVREREQWHLLDPQGGLLYTEGAGRPEIKDLPELPGGYVYTGFIPAGEWLVLSWEEQKFPFTGNAGLLFWRRD